MTVRHKLPGCDSLTRYIQDDDPEKFIKLGQSFKNNESTFKAAYR
jgi:hypothetical protein